MSCFWRRDEVAIFCVTTGILVIAYFFPTHSRYTLFKQVNCEIQLLEFSSLSSRLNNHVYYVYIFPHAVCQNIYKILSTNFENNHDKSLRRCARNFFFLRVFLRAHYVPNAKHTYRHAHVDDSAISFTFTIIVQVTMIRLF